MADRSPLYASLGSAPKKPRPPILKRVSYPAQSSSNGALLGSPRREKITLETGKPDETMAACFLQYCAMCEKQITTPCNSILYCSEACHRKDSNKPLSAANIMSPPASPPLAPSSPKSILQPRAPTGTHPGTEASPSRILADNHCHKPDLDPTEWKPKLSRNSRPRSSRYDSEAFRYLLSFHRSIGKQEDYTSGTNDAHKEDRIDVPDLNSLPATVPATPSLGSTPTTMASSWASTSAGPIAYHDYHRPLMPRSHNRWYSTSVTSASGIDLVTPHIPPPTESAYVKKDVMVGAKTPRGGIGAFFGGELE